MNIHIEKIDNAAGMAIEDKKSKSGDYMFPANLAQALSGAVLQSSHFSMSLEDDRYVDIDLAIDVGKTLLNTGLMPVIVAAYWDLGDGLFVNLIFAINVKGEKYISIGRNIDSFTKDIHIDFWSKMGILEINNIQPLNKGNRFIWNLDWSNDKIVNLKDFISHFVNFKISDIKVSVGVKCIDDINLIENFGNILNCSGDLITNEINGWRIAHGRDKKKHGTLLFGQSECIWIYEINS